MILGTGVDLAEVARVQSAIERYGARFLDRIYTQREQAYVAGKGVSFQRFAARFAAKEAGMKALGTGWRRGVRWRDIEVVNLASGQPTLRLHGEAGQIAAAQGVQRILLSLSHTEETGIAFVIFEGVAQATEVSPTYKTLADSVSR